MLIAGREPCTENAVIITEFIYFIDLTSNFHAAAVCRKQIRLKWGRMCVS